MDKKTCNVCNIVKHINRFNQKNSKSKDCNIRRGVKRYYDKKDKTSIQQKLKYEKNRDKLLQKHNYYRKKRNSEFKDLVRSYVELQNNLKMMEESFKINDTELK